MLEVSPTALPIAIRRHVSPTALPIAIRRHFSPTALPIAIRSYVSPTALPIAIRRYVSPTALPIAIRRHSTSHRRRKHFARNKILWPVIQHSINMALCTNARYHSQRKNLIPPDYITPLLPNLIAWRRKQSRFLKRHFLCRTPITNKPHKLIKSK